MAGLSRVSARVRKTRSTRRGMLLIEARLSLSILTVIGLMLLKLSLNILQPRQWVLAADLDGRLHDLRAGLRGTHSF